MPETRHIPNPTPYASSGDFHRIFDEERDSLYRLSFLLTADHEKAQECFVSGLEDSVKGNPVFKEWARSWARRAIIQNAVRVINPRPMGEDDPSIFDTFGQTLGAEQAEIAAILELRPFERFVHVMSILERYSNQDCLLLLGCARQDVIAARISALHQLSAPDSYRIGVYHWGKSEQEAGEKRIGAKA
jgi:hypothetical protein